MTLQDEDPREKFKGLTPPNPALGRRPYDFKKYAAKEEYRNYEVRARALLNTPRGRAALLQGGIIWRIAMELLGQDAIERAISGPSSDCHLYGKEFMPPSRQLPCYDDQLTEDEMSLIIGAYVIPHRQGRWQNRQPVTVSWWPSRKQWERYYGAAGYWTPACETWFLTRLDGMRSSDIRLRNGQEWYDRLTQHKPARPFHRAHMAFCEHAVATIFGARAAGRDDEAREL
ncbi:hypothetical protein C8Q76DRAFT_608364 [Earliella scabrosa]|nr:hypothetical protein C8Q76DRAFT_608364 [Earliella scabrosa]